MAGNDVRLITYFLGRDEGTVSTMNEIGGTANNTGRRLEDMGKKGTGAFGMISREAERFRRHMGYALAGFGTYEIFNAISKLRDYQTELAQLNAVIGATPEQLNKFGQAAIDISTRTAQPLDDVLQSMTNIAQSIPNLSAAARNHLIPAMAQIEAMGARVSGTDPRSFGSTVLGLATAFVGRNQIQGPNGTKILESIANRLITTQFMSPRVTGQDIATYIPMLAGGAATSGFTLDQMLALFTVGQRVIQRPATTAQYLRQLMIRLHQPTPAERPFFAQAGLTPDVLSGLNKSGGGMTILRTLLLHALSLPGNNLNGMTPEQFLAHPSWKHTTLSPTANEFIQNTIGGRIQSLVAARAITQGLGQIPMATHALHSGKTLDQRFNDMDLSMQKAQTAISNATTSLGNDFMPAISVAAAGLTEFGKGVQHISGLLSGEHDWVNRHTGNLPIVGGRLGGVAQIATLVAGGFIARRGLGKVAGLFGRANPLNAALGAERATMETEAAASALEGKANGSPSAPYWVVIHPLSKTQVPELFGRGVSLQDKAAKDVASTALKDAEHVAEGAGGAAGGTSITKRLARRFGQKAASRAAAGAISSGVEGSVAADILTGGLAALPLAAYQFFQTGNQQYFDHPLKGGNVRLDLGGGYYRQVGGNSLLAKFMGSLGKHQVPRGLQPYFNRFAQHKISQDYLQRVITNYLHNNADAIIGSNISRQIGAPQDARLRAYYNRDHPASVASALSSMFRERRVSRVSGKASDRTLELVMTMEPTEEFKALIKPQQVRVHIPLSEAGSAPTVRGKQKSVRTK